MAVSRCHARRSMLEFGYQPKQSKGARMVNRIAAVAETYVNMGYRMDDAIAMAVERYAEPTLPAWVKGRLIMRVYDCMVGNA